LKPANKPKDLKKRKREIDEPYVPPKTLAPMLKKSEETVTEDSSHGKELRSRSKMSQDQLVKVDPKPSKEEAK